VSLIFYHYFRFAEIMYLLILEQNFCYSLTEYRRLFILLMFEEHCAMFKQENTVCWICI